MTRSRLGLLGLCAVVFGLMAFNSAAAQAEPGAQWLLAEKEGEKLVPFLEASVGLEKDSALITLHAKLSGGTEFLVLCTTPVAENIKLKEGGSIGEGGRVKFTGCTVDLNGALSTPCEPKDKELGVAGTVRTKPGHGLIVLHTLKNGTKDENVLLLPDVGEVFATIEMGAECAVGTKVNVIGEHFIIEDCEHLFLKHLVKHLIQENVELSLLWVISKTEEHKASILGSAWAKLIGAHEGLKFSGDPA